MKYILALIFISTAAIGNAQTQRIKDLLPKGGDINASQQTKAQDIRMRQLITTEVISETILLHLNGKPQIVKTSASLVRLVEPQKITCLEIVTDERKITDYTKDTSIKKLVIIEAKE
nr:hypothetical protein [uncultured Lacibacter sp.]